MRSRCVASGRKGKKSQVASEVYFTLLHQTSRHVLFIVACHVCSLENCGTKEEIMQVWSPRHLRRVASQAVRSVSFQKDPPPNQRRTLTAGRAVSRSPAIKLSPPPKSSLFSLRSWLRLHASQRIAREGTAARS